MFIRYVGSGYKGSRKCISIKGGTVILVTMLALLALTSGIIPATKYIMLEDGIYGAVCKLHSYMISSSYNLATYQDVTDIDVGRGLYSHLQGYATTSDAALGTIEFMCSDPGYQVVVSATDSTDNIQQNIDTDSQTVAVDDSSNRVEKTEGIEGYVVPAVASTGITYSMEQLSDFDFLMSKLYTVPSRALVYESDLVASELMSVDTTMHGDNTSPQILIYHTHSQEGYSDSVAGDDSTSIVAVGTYLAKILSEEYGYNVIHCTEHFDIAGGNLDRSKAYTYAQATLEQILEDNPSIEVVLDIHRDGLPDGYDKLVTNIGGKDVAKIMLFNGISRSSATGDIDYLYNRYQTENLAFSFKLKLEAMECYPEFTRRNYIDAYQYNLHHREKSVLVEVGAQNNTLQEAMNSMEVLAEVLHRVLNSDE